MPDIDNEDRDEYLRSSIKNIAQNTIGDNIGYLRAIKGKLAAYYFDACITKDKEIVKDQICTKLGTAIEETSAMRDLLYDARSRVYESVGIPSMKLMEE